MTQATTRVFGHPTGTSSKSKAFTITAHIARVALGLIFLVFGLNKFLHFIPGQPPTGVAGEFVFGLFKAPYLFPLIAFIEVIGGAFLLAGSLIPFALLILFPININILLFHLTLAPEGTGMSVLLMAAHIFLAVHYWPAYKPMFKIENAWKK